MIQYIKHITRNYTKYSTNIHPTFIEYIMMYVRYEKDISKRHNQNLGRWKLNDGIDKKIYMANIDHSYDFRHLKQLYKP